VDNLWIQGRAAGDHEKEDMTGNKSGTISHRPPPDDETNGGLMIDHKECADLSLAVLGATLRMCVA
jgi:hypothetical protein